MKQCLRHGSAAPPAFSFGTQLQLLAGEPAACPARSRDGRVYHEILFHKPGAEGGGTDAGSTSISCRSPPPGQRTGQAFPIPIHHLRSSCVRQAGTTYRPAQPRTFPVSWIRTKQPELGRCLGRLGRRIPQCFVHHQSPNVPSLLLAKPQASRIALSTNLMPLASPAEILTG